MNHFLSNAALLKNHATNIFRRDNMWTKKSRLFLSLYTKKVVNYEDFLVLFLPFRLKAQKSNRMVQTKSRWRDFSLWIISTYLPSDFPGKERNKEFGIDLCKTFQCDTFGQSPFIICQLFRFNGASL